MKESLSRKIYVYVSTIFLILLCIIMVMPLLKVVAESFSAKKFIENNAVLFWPKGFNLEAYKKVLGDPGVLRAFKNTVFITVVGTGFNLLMTSMFAYPLSRPEFLFKKPLLMMVTITMIFSPPLIPSYLLVKSLHLDNTLWAVIVPGAISAYNFFVLRSFFRSIPGELIDASRIDGCSELRILWNVVLPLSKPALSAVGLFYGVGHWNSYFGPLMYLRDPKYHTLQIKLSNLLISDNMDIPEVTEMLFSPVTIKMTTIVVASVPILIVYPFLQKYFVQGANLGSIKE